MSKDFYKIQGLPDFVPDPNPKKPKRNPLAILFFIAFAIAVLITGISILIFFMADESSEVEPVTDKKTEERTSAKKETGKEQGESKMGKIIKVTPLLTSDDSLNLWILTEKRNPDDNNMYLYNPGSGVIIKSIKADYQLDKRLKIYSLNKKVWVIRDEGNPEIYTYDNETGTELYNPRTFAEKNKEFEPGFKYIYFEKSYPGICYKFTVKDGKEHYYDFKTEEFISYNNFRKEAYSPKDNKAIVTVYELFPERQSQGRNILYKVTGPKYRVSLYSMMYSYDDNGNVQVHEGTAKPLLSEKIFFNGKIVFDDKNYIVIVYNNSFDDQSEKVLTCISTNGEILWEKKLSDIQAIDSKSKSDYTAELTGELLVFQDGKTFAAGLDINSGEVNWRLEF